MWPSSAAEGGSHLLWVSETEVLKLSQKEEECKNINYNFQGEESYFSSFLFVLRLVLFVSFGNLGIILLVSH